MAITRAAQFRVRYLVRGTAESIIATAGAAIFTHGIFNQGQHSAGSKYHVRHRRYEARRPEHAVRPRQHNQLL